MTEEEKAKEILHCNECRMAITKCGYKKCGTFILLMQMAEWKNKQFKDDIYKFCMYCESELIKDKKHLGCAFRSLGNEYCDFIDDMLKKYK